MRIESHQPCPCGSGAELSACCLPYLQGTQSATTAEALMRSRFSAYRLKAYDYLLATWAPESAPASATALADSCQTTEWVGLVVHECQRGQTTDNDGEVSFSAYYRDREQGSALQSLHEHSRFQRSATGWIYVSGSPLRQPPQPGRNTPCVCGSGKKFKHCCL